MTDERFSNYVNLAEAAALLRIHPQSLRRLIKQGKLPTRLFGGKYLLERAVVETFAASYNPRPGRRAIHQLF